MTTTTPNPPQQPTFQELVSRSISAVETAMGDLLTNNRAIRTLAGQLKAMLTTALAANGNGSGTGVDALTLQSWIDRLADIEMLASTEAAATVEAIQTNALPSSLPGAPVTGGDQTMIEKAAAIKGG